MGFILPFAGIQQYLFENNRIDNIFTDVYFEKFTECLNEVLMRYEVRLNSQGKCSGHWEGTIRFLCVLECFSLLSCCIRVISVVTIFLTIIAYN